MTEPALRLVNAETGELVPADVREVDLQAENERLRDQVEQLQADTDGLERELRNKRAQISKLRKERHQDLKLHPKYAAAKRIRDHWRERCRPTARPEPPDDDIELIVARLEHFTEADCFQAVEGAGLDAFKDERGKVHNDLALIFRNSAKVRDFMDRAERAAQRATPQPADPRGLDLLRETFRKRCIGVSAEDGSMAGRCPVQVFSADDPRPMMCAADVELSPAGRLTSCSDGHDVAEIRDVLRSWWVTHHRCETCGGIDFGKAA